MRNIKLTLEYDGTHFLGFQKQKSRRTIQGELEEALRKLFQRKTRVVGSGRTDSGVHAEAQVANFHIDSKLSVSQVEQGLNHYLPRDIAVLSAKEALPSFHSQYSTKWKVYEYRVLNSKSRSPLKRFYTHHIPFRLEISKMKRAARLLVGKHDFRVFESSGGRRKSAIRTIRKFIVKKQGDIIFFTVEADGFLYKMVRSMVGTLLEVGRGKLGLSDFKKILTSKDRRLIGPTVSPRGLTLKQVTH